MRTGGGNVVTEKDLITRKRLNDIAREYILNCFVAFN